MTERDKHIEMAQRLGLVGMRPHLDGIYIDALAAFAKLVADDARATPALPQGVLDYGYSELFWAIAAAVEKTEPGVPRKISVRAFKEKLLFAPSDGVGYGTALPQGVEEFIRLHGYERVWNSYTEYCVSQEDLRDYLSGMAIVPVEPTDEMIDYAERMDWSIPDSRAVVINIWQAMLAAAKEKS